jgi:beta-ureidopropionase
VHDAKAQGAQVMCFQELFYGPYFCQVQDTEYYDYTEPIPDGPTTQRFQRLAKETGMVLVLPMYESSQPRASTTTPPRHRRRRHLPRQVPQAAHPAGEGVLGEVLLRPRHGRVPRLRHRRRQGRRVHLLRPPLPRGLACARPQRRRDRVQPVGHHRGLSASTCGASSSRPRPSRTCTTWARSTGWASRPLGDNDFYGQSYFVDPEGKFVGDVGDAYKPELIVRDLDLDKIKRGARPLGLLP